MMEREILSEKTLEVKVGEVFEITEKGAAHLHGYLHTPKGIDVLDGVKGELPTGEDGTPLIGGRRPEIFTLKALEPGQYEVAYILQLGDEEKEENIYNIIAE
ncbi:hypothetical protein GOV11_02145 [Candidatus Woesearchaeota archaeon]|nr:hypothetical protein [Candidatus Woesearchaeota archaeon]